MDLQLNLSRPKEVEWMNSVYAGEENEHTIVFFLITNVIYIFCSYLVLDRKENNCSISNLF